MGQRLALPVSLQQRRFHKIRADDEAVAGILALLADPALPMLHLDRNGPLVKDRTAARAAELVTEGIRYN